MTWQTVLALAVFIVVCGFIAYWGDILGRRLGKRRLTLFGLRPRYTAIVTTTITGMLIALFTIVAMGLVSKDVQKLILRGHRTLQEAERRVQEATTEARAAGLQRDILQSEISDLDAELETLQTDLSDSKRALAKAEDRLKELTSQRDRLLSEIKSLKADVTKNKQALDSAERLLARTEHELRMAEQEIETRREEIRTKESLIANLRAQSAELEAYLKDALERSLARWERRVIFRPGEEIARGTVQAEQPEALIRADIIHLLEIADRIARAKGAVVGGNGRAVRIISKEISTIGSRRTLFLEEAESLDLIVSKIASASGSVVVRIVSVLNSFEDEQAQVEVELNYNRLIYPAGALVAQTTIDGRLSRGEVLGAVVTFLRKDVRSSAIRNNLIPTYDESGEPSVGAIEWGEVFDLVDAIIRAGQPVEVKARAKEDTWSVGPLNLELAVSTPR